jgi:type IV fimbrial biogenesis protein FimT
MEAKNHAGFTLWELLVTLLVAGILIGIGVPSLQDAQRNSAMSGAANDLITGLLAARAEAVKRRVPVTLCASPDPNAAIPVCSQDGAGANGGFIVWVDWDPAHVDANQSPTISGNDRNAAVDATEVTPLQPVLIRQAPPPSMVPNGTLRIFANSGYITFQPNGFPAPAVGPPVLARVLYCDDRGNRDGPGGAAFSTARAIRVEPTGRANVETSKTDVTDAVAFIGGGASCP